MLEAQTQAGYAPPMNGFMRHIEACNTAQFPGGRVAFRLGEAQVGWVQPGLGAAMAALPGVFRSARGIALTVPADLPTLAAAMAQQGFFQPRGEMFDVRADPVGPALARIDRGALPKFGIMAQGAHLNGLVRKPDGVHLWVARRAANKALDPGKLDHIVAGGVPAGLTPFETLVKEAAEEAAIPPELTAQAVRTGRIGYAMERPEGLRRDLLTCYDLYLPDYFVPHPADGEVEDFELWPIERAIIEVRDGERFKFNVNLVLIHLFLRLGLIAGAEAAQVSEAMRFSP